MSISDQLRIYSFPIKSNQLKRIKKREKEIQRFKSPLDVCGFVFIVL